MDSSERLDDLVTRARALFESKHGSSSQGCFAAFSPAKVTVMGDYVEGSGGLVLQMALDRRVVVFGRGRVLPDRSFPKRVIPPRPKYSRDKVAPGSSGTGTWDRGGEGGTGGKGAGGRGPGGMKLSKARSKRSINRRNTPGKALDNIVQGLVFGKNARSKSVAVASSSGESGGTMGKNRSAVLGFVKSGGGGSSNGGYASSTPTARYDSNSSTHSSSRLSAPIVVEAGSATSVTAGVPPIKIAARPIDRSHSSGSTILGVAHPPPTEGAIDGTSEKAAREDYAFSADSGSTTTEDGFPVHACSSCDSSSHASSPEQRKNGVVGGTGSGRDGDSTISGVDQNTRRPSVDSVGTDDSSHAGGDGGGDYAGSGAAGAATMRSASSAKMQNGTSDAYAQAQAALAAATMAAGGPVADRTGETSEFPRKRGGGRGSSSGTSTGGDQDTLTQLPFSHPILYRGSSSTDVPDPTEGDQPRTLTSGTMKGGHRHNSGYGHGGGDDGGEDDDESDADVDADGEEQSPTLEVDATIAQALVEAAQAEAEIQAAAAADLEAERQRTSRIYCESCPKDGVLEFMANRGMRGSGDSWKGLMAAVAAEYAQDLPPGKVLGIEAVVVSDLPGSLTGQGLSSRAIGNGSKAVLSPSSSLVVSASSPMAAAAAAADLDGSEGYLYGWENAARAALLMATATFLEEVLEMSRFPRMKAMRCYSASLKCGPLPAAAAAATATAAAAASGSDVSPGDELSESVTRTKKGRRGDKKMSLPSSPSSSTSSTSSTSSSLSLSSSSTAATGCGVDRPAPIPFASEEACPLPCQGRGEWDTRRTKLEAESATAARGPMFGKEMEEEMMMTPGGLRLDDLLAIADCDPPGAVLVDTGLQTCCHVPVKGPRGESLAVVIAQPMSLNTAKRLRSQAEYERLRGSATCRAVVEAARDRHPEACLLQDIPPETLEVLLSSKTSRSQSRAAAAAAAADTELSASQTTSSRGDTTPGKEKDAERKRTPKSAGGGRSAGFSQEVASHGTGGGRKWLSNPSGTTAPSPRFLSADGSSAEGSRVEAGDGWRLSPDVMAHARHLATEYNRVALTAAAFSVGDMDAVGRLMLHSRRSAGQSISSSRGRQEPEASKGSRLASMASLLPGVYISRHSEGRGGCAIGAVVAVVDPSAAEGVLRAITTRGAISTRVAWGGFTMRMGGGSGVVRIA